MQKKHKTSLPVLCVSCCGLVLRAPICDGIKKYISIVEISRDWAIMTKGKSSIGCLNVSSFWEVTALNVANRCVPTSILKQRALGVIATTPRYGSKNEPSIVVQQSRSELFRACPS